MYVKIKKRNKEEYMKELVVYISDCLGASEYIESVIYEILDKQKSNGKSRLEVELEIDGRLTC